MLECGHDRACQRPKETLPPLRPAIAPQAHRHAVGGSGRVQAQALLRPDVHGGRYEQAGGDKGRASVARSEASKGRLRAVRRDRSATCPPPGRELAQQRSRQPHDALPELPFETALGAGRAHAETPVGSRARPRRPSRVLRSHGAGHVARRCGRDARAHIEPLGKAPSDLAAYAFRTLATRLAARGSAGADQLVRMMWE